MERDADNIILNNNYPNHPKMKTLESAVKFLVRLHSMKAKIIDMYSLYLKMAVTGGISCVSRDVDREVQDLVRGIKDILENLMDLIQSVLYHREENMAAMLSLILDGKAESTEFEYLDPTLSARTENRLGTALNNFLASSERRFEDLKRKTIMWQNTNRISQPQHRIVLRFVPYSMEYLYTTFYVTSFRWDDNLYRETKQFLVNRRVELRECIGDLEPKLNHSRNTIMQLRFESDMIEQEIKTTLDVEKLLALVYSEPHSSYTEPECNETVCIWSFRQKCLALEQLLFSHCRPPRDLAHLNFPRMDLNSRTPLLDCGTGSPAAVGGHFGPASLPPQENVWMPVDASANSSHVNQPNLPPTPPMSRANMPMMDDTIDTGIVMYMIRGINSMLEFESRTRSYFMDTENYFQSLGMQIRELREEVSSLREEVRSRYPSERPADIIGSVSRSSRLSHSTDLPGFTLNNQVPPGSRANNYYDNFKSNSRQNFFPSNSNLNTLSPVEQVSRSSATMPFLVPSPPPGNRRDVQSRNERPAMKSTFSFVENIGPKTRNIDTTPGQPGMHQGPGSDFLRRIHQMYPMSQADEPVLHSASARNGSVNTSEQSSSSSSRNELQNYLSGTQESSFAGGLNTPFEERAGEQNLSNDSNERLGFSNLNEQEVSQNDLHGPENVAPSSPEDHTNNS